MLIIRLSRVGKKKQPTYRLVISEKARDTQGRSLEILGDYNPRTKVKRFNEERIKYWISKGAQASDSVWNIFLQMKLVDGGKRKVVPTPKPKVEEAKPEVKAEEKKEEKKEEVKEEPKAEEAPAA